MAKFKYFLIAFLVILGFSGYGYFKSMPKPESGANLPVIEINPKSFDFGEIEYGKIADYDFQIKNSGNETLEIKKVSTSCGCTTAKVDSETIAPGQTANLHVKYDTGAMSGSHGKGKQERIIYIRSSDPIRPQAEAMIYADVK